MPMDRPMQPDAENNANGDKQRDASAVDGAREDVAPEFIGAHPMRSRGRLEARRKILRGGIVRSDPWSKEREKNE